MQSPDINIAIFGHAQHGKSTLAGRLLHEFGSIDDKMLKELEALANSKGKDFNAFNLAFLERRPATYSKNSNKLDDQSRTVVPERGNVQLDDGRVISLIDTPGFSRFLSSIIYGAHLSDLAILTVEASAGVEYGTINIARILSAFGIPIIGIMVTKMDIVGYSEIRYKEVCNSIISDLINEINNIDEIPIVPISALTGEGISSFNKIDWYHSDTVIGLIENSREKSKFSDIQKIHFVVEGGNVVHSLQGIGTVVVGTLESGTLNKVDKLIVEPASTIQNENLEFSIKSMQYARSITDDKTNRSVAEIPARAIVAVALSDLKLQVAKVLFKRGAILGKRENKPKVASEISAEVIFFEPDTVYEGKEYVFYTNASQSVAQVITIPPKESNELFYHTKKNKNRDNVIATKVLETESYSIKLRLKYPICIEDDIIFQRLTRFILKQNNKIVACGRCLNIIK